MTNRLILRSVGVYAGPLWILITGAWNDSGAWDDSAAWQDS